MTTNLYLSDDYEDMFHGAVYGLAQYIREQKLQTLVIGLSGGIDSAVTAIIAVQAIKEAGTETFLRGFVLPTYKNKPEETQRGIEVGKSVCREDLLEVRDISETYRTLIAHIRVGNGHGYEEYQCGNIAARLRMMHLFNAAADWPPSIVLSTDNLTEYYLGFWTLHGDVGNFGPIQNLWKTEVYGIADFIASGKVESCIPHIPALKLCIDAVPTDGLGITDSDLDQILKGWVGSHRAGYREVDNILIKYLTEKPAELEKHPTIIKHKHTEFKRKDPISIPRDILLWKYNRR